jgi:hypothetical protein
MWRFLVIFAVIVGLDLIWLEIRRSFHEKLILSVQKSPLRVRLVPAFLAYMVLSVSVWYFVFQFGHVTSPLKAFQTGALLGLSMAGFFDFVNYATLDKYELEMVVTDIAETMFICGAGAAIATGV